jgi:hypothetical protein
MLRGRYGRGIRQAWQANLDFLRADRDEFFAALARYFDRRTPLFFRYHIGGDFIDTDHLQRAIKLAREFPGIKFLAFSKRFSFFPRPRTIPSNFALIASAWTGGSALPAGYRVAYMRDPANPDPRIPARALDCHGGCDTCALCWHLRGIRADVVFNKH